MKSWSANKVRLCRWRVPASAAFMLALLCLLPGMASGVQDMPLASVDIFAIRTWAPPPPPAPVVEARPAPPPRPEAPPLPFRFLGKIVAPGAATAFLLARGDRVVSVGVGETLDGTYLVEKQESGQLYFLYKPLKVRQSISIGRDS